MNPENTANAASNSDNFANIRDIIPPKVGDRNIPAEYLISDNFLVPGVITQYFEDKVLFKPNLSDKIFNVPYNQIRHLPDIIDCKYEVGHKVEVYRLDPKLNLHGWSRSTITSHLRDTYVTKLEERRALNIVQRDKMRTIITGRETQNCNLRAVAWRNRAVSFADMQTWEYENFINVYYKRKSTKKSTDASVAAKADYEDAIFLLILLLVLFWYFDF